MRHATSLARDSVEAFLLSIIVLLLLACPEQTEASLTLSWDQPDPDAAWTFIVLSEVHIAERVCRCPPAPCLLPGECLPRFDCICRYTTWPLWDTRAYLYGEPMTVSWHCAETPGSCCVFRYPRSVDLGGNWSVWPDIGPDFDWGRP